VRLFFCGSALARESAHRRLRVFAHKLFARKRAPTNSASRRRTLLSMKRITVIHHSASGGTRALVAAFCEGARECEDVNTVTRSADVCTREDLLESGALVFASPENFGYMAGSMKAMFDRLFYLCMADTTAQGGGVESLLAGRAYAILICAGNDGTGALQSIERIVTGWRMKPMHAGLIARRLGGVAGSSKGELRAADLSAAKELGAALATALSIGAI
jgi:multimeric flavodoxin WrbA